MVNKRFLEMAGKMKNKVITNKKLSEKELEREIFSSFVDTERANDIRWTIKEKAKFDGYLIRDILKKENPLSANLSTSYAILEYLLGHENQAYNIEGEIINKIGLKKGLLGQIYLLQEKTENPGDYTISNSKLAILEYIVGNQDNAIEIRKNIVKKIGYKGCLIKDKIKDQGNPTISTNAMFGTLNCLVGFEDEAIEIRNYIANTYYPILSNNILMADAYSACNFALLEYFIGNKNEAKDIAQAYMNAEEKKKESINCMSSFGILCVAGKLKQISEERTKQYQRERNGK